MLKNLFIALVRPGLEFAYVVWFPRLIKNRNVIKGLQKRASKLIPGFQNIPYEERVKRIKLPSLYYC